MNKKKIENKQAKYLVIIIIMLVTILTSFNLFLFFNQKETIEYITDENIVFFGDSITEGYNIREFFPDNKVINSGISGNKVYSLLDRIQNDVYAYNPSKIFILIGINDLVLGISKKEILENIQRIINGIKINRQYANIYVESIYPINKDMMREKDYSFNNDVTNEAIKELNLEIKAMCKENNITYINVYDQLLDDRDNLKSAYSKEGLHLNDLGYFKVTKALEKYVSSNFKNN